MKLTSNQAAAVKQRVNIDPIDEENPVVEPLKQAFGDHTFYIVSDGLFVLEPVNDPGQGDEPVQFILVAAWTDEKKNALKAVEPQQTGTVIDLAIVTDSAEGGEGEAE